MTLNILNKKIDLPATNKTLTGIKKELLQNQSVDNFNGDINVSFIENPKLNFMLSLDAINSTSRKLKALNKDDYKGVLLLIENQLEDSIDHAIAHLYKLDCTGKKEMKDVAYSFLKKHKALEGVEEEVVEHFNYESYGKSMEVKSVYLKDIEGVIWHYDKEKKCILCKLKKATIFSFQALFVFMLLGMGFYVILSEALKLLNNG